MKLVIPRSKWQRGTGCGDLWDSQTDCGCALGHLGLAIGYSKEDLMGLGTPAEVLTDVDEDKPKWPEWVLRSYYDEDHPDADDEGEVYKNTAFVDRIIEVNDREYDPEREDRVKTLFAAQGVEVEFTWE